MNNSLHANALPGDDQHTGVSTVDPCEATSRNSWQWPHGVAHIIGELRDTPMPDRVLDLATRSPAAFETVWTHPALSDAQRETIQWAWKQFSLTDIIPLLPGWVGLGLGPVSTDEWKGVLSQIQAAPVRIGTQLVRIVLEVMNGSPSLTPALRGMGAVVAAKENLLLFTDLYRDTPHEQVEELWRTLEQQCTPVQLAWICLAAPELIQADVNGLARLVTLGAFFSGDALLSTRLGSLHQSLSGQDASSVTQGARRTA